MEERRCGTFKPTPSPLQLTTGEQSSYRDKVNQTTKSSTTHITEKKTQGRVRLKTIKMLEGAVSIVKPKRLDYQNRPTHFVVANY